jgi:hypothetical protein
MRLTELNWPECQDAPVWHCHWTCSATFSMNGVVFEVIVVGRTTCLRKRTKKVGPDSLFHLHFLVVDVHLIHYKHILVLSWLPVSLEASLNRADDQNLMTSEVSWQLSRGSNGCEVHILKSSCPITTDNLFIIHKGQSSFEWTTHAMRPISNKKLKGMQLFSLSDPHRISLNKRIWLVDPFVLLLLKIFNALP